MPYNTEEIKLAYKSRYNFKRKNQVNLLMITVGKIWQDNCCKNKIKAR